MRSREEKRKCKGQESTIGKIIYGFLLFMPLLAIAVTCGYAIFNKNAYKSYYGENINQIQYIDVSSNNNIDSDKTYYFYGDVALNTEYSGNVYYTNCEYITGLTDISTERINFINNSVHLYYYRGTSITFYDNENNSLVVGGLAVIKLDGLISNPTSSNTYRMIKEIQYNKNSYVSEVFYYSTDRIQQSNLFNWAQNSIIYTTTNATCNALSITTPFIPLLLSYWLIISVIYFLYDIALMLVWIIHKKIHELQESI